jgi:hypothetical protein
MDIQEARKIVYGFADFHGRGAPLIPDASTLPWDKQTLKHAYSIFITAMRAEQQKNPISFARNGYEDTLSLAMAVMIRIDDYHRIAPEDADAVARVNALPSNQPFNMETMQLLMKYPLGGAK